MNSSSRTKNTIVNLFWSIGSQLLILILNFGVRKLFIISLGEELLGVNGVLSSVLSLLSISELGIGNILIFNLYEPVKNNKEEEIGRLLSFFRIIYTYIIITLFFIGIITLTLLPFFINVNFPLKRLYIYFLLFLFDSICSYIFVERISLLNADQKIFIQKQYTCIFILGKLVLQFLCLYWTKSYFLYLIIQLISTILLNYVLGYKIGNMYPFIKKKFSKLNKEKKNYIFKNTKYMFLFKIGVIAMNNTDNILISLFVGTISVGYYSNYSMIINSLNAFVITILQSFYSSIGNLNAEENKKKQYDIFKILVMIFNGIAVVFSSAMLLCINDFIKLFAGSQYILNNSVVIILVFQFFYTCATNPIWCYRETLGLFKEAKTLMLQATFINLFFSIIFGLKWGITGILVATVIARLCTTLTREPIIIYKKCFQKSSFEYFFQEAWYLFCLIISSIMTYLITYQLVVDSWKIWLIKGGLCVFCSLLVFIILNLKSKEGKYIITMLKNKLEF